MTYEVSYTYQASPASEWVEWECGTCHARGGEKNRLLARAAFENHQCWVPRVVR